MTPDDRAHTLAAQVSVRYHDEDPDTCRAWIDSADRVCGKPSAEPWLCARHITVAHRRLRARIAADQAAAARARR